MSVSAAMMWTVGMARAADAPDSGQETGKQGMSPPPSALVDAEMRSSRLLSSLQMRRGHRRRRADAHFQRPGWRRTVSSVMGGGDT